MRVLRHSMWLAGVFVALSAFAAQAAEDETTPGWATGHSLKVAPVCLNFLPVGICVWITCVLYACDVDTSIKYGHFNPDAVVEVTNPQGVNRAEDPKRPDTHNRNHNNLIYKETHVFGHVLAGQIYCPSQASAVWPYFFSTLDSLGWRWGVPDMFNAAALIPGQREVGDWPKNSWGNLYPRAGWTVQSSEPKSAAVNAQRAGDIITRDGQGHVYYAMTGDADDGEKFTWEPEGLEENTDREGYWQRIYPEVAPTCEVFGADDTLAVADWGGGQVSEDGDYAYTLWRPYTCCEIEGAVLLLNIDWIDYPP